MTALFIAHGHPTFNKGGAEIAAYRLFQAMRSCDGWEQSAFLAAAPDDSMFKPGCQVLGLSDHQWLVKRSTDPLLHDTAINLTHDVHGFLFEALSIINPKIIHIHHFVHIGLDLIHALRKWFPEAKIILTLHEYWGMCPFEGRLLTSMGTFCDGPEPDACVRCLGETYRLKLAVRRLRIQHFFSAVDHFISPSYFLKQRYVDWGIADEKISVVENLPLPAGQDTLIASPDALSRTVQKDSICFAYFGQMNRWKGIDLILEAFKLLLARYPDVRLELHGLSQQMLSEDNSRLNNSFIFDCRELLKSISMGSVHLMGMYEPEEISRRMKSVDVVVMASRWYENSPMVIQEAFGNGVPVVAPDLGGMAEKITHHKTGLLYEAGNAEALVHSLSLVIEHRELLEEMKVSAKESAPSFKLILESHRFLYEKR